MEKFSGWMKFGTSIAAGVLIILMFVLTFVDIGGTKPGGAFDAESTNDYIKDLSVEPHPYGYWNDNVDMNVYVKNLVGIPLDDDYNPEKFKIEHEKNRKYIVDELKSFGLGEASYTEQPYNATMPTTSFVEYFQGVTDLNPENAHLIPDDKFPMDVQEYDDGEYKDELKRNYVENYVAAKSSLEDLKAQVQALTGDAPDYTGILEEAFDAVNKIGYTANSTKTITGQLMPDFGATIAPFVIEYNRYLTNKEVEQLRVLSDEEQWGYEEANGVSDYLQNVIAYFPSRETIAKGNATTSDILAFVCHYDSVNEGPGAVDDNAALAGLLSACKKLAQDYSASDNDICFIFTDAEEKGLWGMKSLYHLTSMSDFFNRLSLIFNFEGRGTNGTVAMFETSANNQKLVSSYAKGVNNTVYTSSFATFIYNMLPNVTDMNFVLSLAEKDIISPSVLNFANIGGGENYHTEQDTFENMTASIPAQVYAVANSAIKAYRDYDLKTLKAKSDAVYFSYYDLFMVNYSAILGYILAIIALGLGAAFFVFNAKNKRYSLKNLAKGLAVQAIMLLAGALIFFVGGLFVYVIATGAMGIEPYGLFVFEYTYSKIAAVAIITGFAAVACFFLYKLFAKLFKVSGKEILIGANFLVLMIGVVLSFALPSAAYMFIFTAILSQAICLCELLLGDKLQKRGMSFDGLNIHTLPFILTMFMPLSLALMFTEALGHIVYPIFGLFLALMLGTFLPAFSAKSFAASLISPFKKEKKESEDASNASETNTTATE